MTDHDTTSNGTYRHSSTVSRRRVLQSAATGIATGGVAGGAAASAGTGTAGSQQLTSLKSSTAEVHTQTLVNEAEDSSWHTIDYKNSYNNPVVLTNPMTYWGSDPGLARLDEDATTGGCDIALQEWPHNSNLAHGDEDVGALVVEDGARETGSGTKIEAGTFTLSHDNIQSVTFSQSFDRTPIVLSDVQTYNGPDAVLARNRSLDSSGVDIQMQEQETDNDSSTHGASYHPDERIGYLAAEEGVGTLAGRKFEAGKIPNVDHDHDVGEWSRISFTRSYNDPIFLGDIQTFNGSDTAGLRYRNLSSTGVEVFVEEDASNGETKHTEEDIGYVVFEGSSANVTALIQQFDFRDGFSNYKHEPVLDNPCVFANPISYNNSEPAHTRLRNVTSANGVTEFEAQVEEWDYLENNGVADHPSETVSSLAIDAGTHTTSDTSNEAGTPLEAGTLTLGDANVKTVSFSQSFSTEPVVLSEVQTYNGGDSVVTRNENVSTSSFDVGMQEQQNLMDNGSTTMYHADETVAYLAVEPGTGTIDGKPFEAETVTGVDENWQTISFSQSYNDPRFLADMQTRNDDDPCGLRYRNLTSDSVDVFVEEEESSDNETGHGNEEVGYLVIEGNPGYLGGGVNYSYTIARSQADHHATTWSELYDYLDRSSDKSASAGEIVWVDDDITVDPGPQEGAWDGQISMVDYVTLASGRGVPGDTAHTIDCPYETDSGDNDTDGIRLLHLGEECRITGVRFRGPIADEASNDGTIDGDTGKWASALFLMHEQSGDPEDSSIYSEIDNCEIFGWDGRAIEARSPGIYIHHCDIYDNPGSGYGYGVGVADYAHPLIKACTFNNNRHSIAASKYEGTSDTVCGYTVENCWFGPDSELSTLDHHGPAPDTEMTIRNCTIEATDTWGEKLRHKGESNSIPKFLDVEDTWFHHLRNEEPCDTGDDQSDGDTYVEPIWPVGDWDCTTTWSDLNIYLTDNYFDNDSSADVEPDDSIGHAR